MDPEKLAAMPIPVYPATAKLTSWSIQKVITTLLDTVDLDALGDPLPAEIAAREKFLPVADAYRLIHAAADRRQTGSAPGTGSATRKPWCSSPRWPGAGPSSPPRRPPPAGRSPDGPAGLPSTASCRSP